MIRLLVAAFVACLALVGCGLVQFDVTEAGDAQVPACVALQCVLPQLGFAAFNNLDLSQSQQWQNNNANKNEVSSVLLTAATLDVTVPDGGDMSFLQSLQFYVDAADAGQALVAEGDSFPSGQSHVALTPYPVELAPYVKADAMTVTTNASGTQPQQDTTLHATLTFHVKL
jgi:hypothetical protein